VEETNSIGTAWLRLDLLSEEPRARAQELFRQYVDLRLDVYSNVTDQERTARAITAVGEQQTRIWQFLMEQVRGNPTQPLPVALLPPVNQMFDIATSRILATRQHPPLFIFVMLLMLVLVSAFFVGFSQSKVSRQSMVHMLGFALTTALALYLIIDLEYPRVGIIRVDSFDLALHELRESMN
jgi:hypothetical protein